MSDPINSVPAPEPRYARRLPDKILTAFHQACDQGDIEVAVLLDVLEFMVSRTHNLPAGMDRRSKDSLVAAHERLWPLRHPAAGREINDNRYLKSASRLVEPPASNPALLRSNAYPAKKPNATICADLQFCAVRV
jgi:hypothetical protein